MSSYLDGIIGGTGLNAFSTLASSFVQPAVNANVSVDLGNTSWAAIGLTVFIEVGGSYQVVSIATATSMTIKNLGGTSNAALGVTVPANGRVTVAGGTGASGTGGSAIPAPDYVATSNIVLTGAQTVDGISVPSGKLVLCTAQTATAEKGYWLVNTGGAWTRPLFYNSDATVAALLGIASGAVLSGTLGSGSVWAQSAGVSLLGAKTWVPLPDAAVKAAVINVPPPVYVGPPSADTAGQTAVTAMINAYGAKAALRRGTTVRLAAGYDYWINGTLFFDNTQGVRLEGGGGATNVGGTRILTTAVSSVATGFDSFTAPAVNGTVVVTVRSTAGWQIATGAASDMVYRLDDDETSPDYYTCTAIGSGVVTLKNIGAQTNTTPGGTVPAGFARSTETIVSMRSCSACTVDKLALISVNQAYNGYVVDFDGSVFASDGALSKVRDVSAYGPEANATPPLLAMVASSPAVSITGVILCSCDILVKFPVGGTRGTATFKVSTDGGRTWELGSDVTPIATAATWAFPATSTCFGLTLNFPTGTYSTSHVYSARQGIIRGIRLPNCFNCTVENCHFANMHDGVFVSSVRNEVKNISNTLGMTGYAVYSINSSGLKVDITPEPGIGGYGRAGAYDVNSDYSDINVQSGDQWTGGSIVYLIGCRAPIVHGVMQVGPGGGAPIYVQGCANVKVRGAFFGDSLITIPAAGAATLGIDVENVSGFTWNPKTLTGTLIAGSNFQNVRYYRAGLNAQADAQLAGDTLFMGRMLTPPSTLILSTGANVDVHVDGVTLEIIGPGGAFATHGFLQYGNGQRVRLRNTTAFAWTISNQSGTETVASSRIITGTGADVVIAAGGAAELEYSNTDSRWHLYWHT